MHWRKKPTPQEQVDRAVKELERGNLFILRAAHFFAFALIVATSVASLISLAAKDVALISTKHANVAQEANAAIIFLLVAAMDTGMLYAAISLRIGVQRGKRLRDMSWHVAIMVLVALLEAGTYSYMLYKYENPQDWLAWTLIIARAAAVPCLSIYLAMAQRITIQPEDISYMAERFTGIGVLRDMAVAANDPELSLARKIQIYQAAATLSGAQHSRLTALHVAVSGQVIDSTLSTVDSVSRASQSATEPIALTPPDPDNYMSAFVGDPPTPPPPAPPVDKPKKKRVINHTGKPRVRKAVMPKPDERQEAVFTHLDQHPNTSTRKLATLFGLSQATAQADKRAWKARQASNQAKGQAEVIESQGE